MRREFAMLAAALMLAATPTAIGHEEPHDPGEILAEQANHSPGPIPADVSDVYQDDGGSGQDAADTCEQAGQEPLELQPGGDPGHGELMPGLATLEEATTLGDLRDFWRLEIEDPDREEVRVAVDTRTPLGLGSLAGFQVNVTVLDPSCEELAEGSVSADGELVISAPIDETGSYRVELAITNPLLDRTLPILDGEPIPAARHCSPMCFEYHAVALE